MGLFETILGPGKKQLESEQIDHILNDMDTLTATSLGNMIDLSKYDIMDRDAWMKDLSPVILSFCEKALRAGTQAELEDLLSIKQIKAIAKKHMPDFLHETESEILKKGVYIEYKDLIDLACKVSKMAWRNKLASSIDETKRPYLEAYRDLYDQVPAAIKKRFYYIGDTLTIGMAAAHLFFVERCTQSLSRDSEFYKIIYNMNEEFDTKLIIEKTRPLYDAFYRPALGSLVDDDLYAIAVTIILNGINRPKELPDIDKILGQHIEYREPLEDYLRDLEKWATGLALKDPDLESRISIYVEEQILRSTYGLPFYIRLSALGRADSLCGLYKKSVEVWRITSARKRYLAGDFELEKEELRKKT